MANINKEHSEKAQSTLNELLAEINSLPINLCFGYASPNKSLGARISYSGDKGLCRDPFLMKNIDGFWVETPPSQRVFAAASFVFKDFAYAYYDEKKGYLSTSISSKTDNAFYIDQSLECFHLDVFPHIKKGKMEKTYDPRTALEIISIFIEDFEAEDSHKFHLAKDLFKEFCD